jgi:disulfide bond formation protein DsbB
MQAAPCPITTPLGRPALVLAAVVAASIGALVTALATEYVLGVRGCTLCVYERVPYAVTAVLALAGLTRPVFARIVLVACVIVFAAGAMLAAYHVGVQQGWWAEVGACEGTLPSAGTVTDLRAALAAKPTRPACDVVDWSLFGLSLAAFNGLFSLVLAILGAAALWCRARHPDKRDPA